MVANQTAIGLVARTTMGVAPAFTVKDCTKSYADLVLPMHYAHRFSTAAADVASGPFRITPRPSLGFHKASYKIKHLHVSSFNSKIEARRTTLTMAQRFAQLFDPGGSIFRHRRDYYSLMRTSGGQGAWLV